MSVKLSEDYPLNNLIEVGNCRYCQTDWPGTRMLAGGQSLHTAVSKPHSERDKAVDAAVQRVDGQLSSIR